MASSLNCSGKRIFAQKSPNLDSAINSFAGHASAMLTEVYIEALLVDEELADQVFEACEAGEIDDAIA